jgi:hypothetical protein
LTTITFPHNMIQRYYMWVSCKRGKHFLDLRAAKDCANTHSGGCASCDGIDWVSSSEEKHYSIVNPKPQKTSQQHITDHNQCPLHKKEEVPCPRCCHSEAISTRIQFLNTVTWWYCHYPNIINLSMLKPEDILGNSEGSA